MIIGLGFLVFQYTQASPHYMYSYIPTHMYTLHAREHFNIPIERKLSKSVGSGVRSRSDFVLE